MRSSVALWYIAFGQSQLSDWLWMCACICVKVVCRLIGGARVLCICMKVICHVIGCAYGWRLSVVWLLMLMLVCATVSRSTVGSQHVTSAQSRMSSVVGLVSWTAARPINSCRLTPLCQHHSVTVILIVITDSVWFWVSVSSAGSAIHCLLFPTAARRCHVSQKHRTRWVARRQMSRLSVHACRPAAIWWPARWGSHFYSSFVQFISIIFPLLL